MRDSFPAGRFGEQMDVALGAIENLMDVGATPEDWAYGVGIDPGDFREAVAVLVEGSAMFERHIIAAGAFQLGVEWGRRYSPEHAG